MKFLDFIRDKLDGDKTTDLAKVIEQEAYEKERLKYAVIKGKEKAKEEFEKRKQTKKMNYGFADSLKDFASSFNNKDSKSIFGEFNKPKEDKNVQQTKI